MAQEVHCASHRLNPIMVLVVMSSALLCPAGHRKDLGLIGGQVRGGDSGSEVKAIGVGEHDELEFAKVASSHMYSLTRQSYSFKQEILMCL